MKRVLLIEKYPYFKNINFVERPAFIWTHNYETRSGLISSYKLDESDLEGFLRKYRYNYHLFFYKNEDDGLVWQQHASEGTAKYVRAYIVKFN